MKGRATNLPHGRAADQRHLPLDQLVSTNSVRKRAVGVEYTSDLRHRVGPHAAQRT